MAGRSRKAAIPIKETAVGTGITAKTVVEVDRDAIFGDVDPWERGNMDRWLEYAKVLKRYYDQDNWLVRHKEIYAYMHQKWEKFPQNCPYEWSDKYNDRCCGFRFYSKEIVYIEEDIEKHTCKGPIWKEYEDTPWFVKSILKLISDIEFRYLCEDKQGRLSRKNAGNFLSLAVDLGMLIKEFEIKSQWEADALRGEKQRQTATAGGASTRRHSAAQRCAEVRRLHSSGQSLKNAFRLAGKALGCSASAVKHDWYAQPPEEQKLSKR